MDKNDIFIVSPGRSVLTAKRGMAHAGGKITLADVPAKTMAEYVKSGKVTIDEEAVAARKAAKAEAEAASAKAVKEGKARKVAADEAAKVEAAKVEAAKVEADKVAADKVAADKVAADKVAAAKVEAAKVEAVPATQAEIIEAIGVLDKDNTEHWTVGGSPQVSAIETLIGKQISAGDRDAAWAAMQASK